MKITKMRRMYENGAERAWSLSELHTITCRGLQVNTVSNSYGSSIRGCNYAFNVELHTFLHTAMLEP